MEIAIENCVQSDQALVDQAQAGDKKAFGELAQRHYLVCLKLAGRILRDGADAQDAVQEAMWKAFTGLDQYRATAPFLNWLLRIVTNQCLMVLRTRKRVQWVYIDTADGLTAKRKPFELCVLDANPETATLHRERRAMFQEELKSLPAIFRTVMVLRDVNELPMNTVAKHLGITVGAAKSRLFRARNELGKRVVIRSGQDSEIF